MHALRHLKFAALIAALGSYSTGEVMANEASLQFPPLSQLQPNHQSWLPSAPWESLTPAQVSRYKSLWIELGPDDLPPYPTKGFEALLSKIREQASEVDAREVLMLSAKLDAEGAVVDVKAVRYSDDQLVKRAVWAVVDTRFRPALCKGSPCASTVPVVVRVPK